MPFHFCTDELLMTLAMIPFIGILFRKLHVWWHKHFHHQCHEKGCEAQHLDHVAATVASIPTEAFSCIDEHGVDAQNFEEIGYRLTHRGLVVATVLYHGPMTHEQVMSHCPGEDI